MKPHDVRLDAKQVQDLFAAAHDQWEPLFGLYRMVYPDWEQIAHVDGFPKCSEKTWEQIAKWFMAFDQVHHPDVIPGGCWFNHGFSSEKEMGDWLVEPCPVTYKEQTPCPS
jgi:hypothetical protein